MLILNIKELNFLINYMWIKIKDEITHGTAWYRNHTGELFEVFMTDILTLNSNRTDFYYAIKRDNLEYLYVDPIDVIVVEPRREKINKIKQKL